LQKISTVKGTKDLLGDDLSNHENIVETFSRTCEFFCCSKISTPIIEHASIFTKSLGVSSDVVSKEMYSFTDQGGDPIVLRPEGTAAIARALITNSLQEKQLQKFFYCGPMFRRERPQLGRLRQFHQIGVEFFDNSNFLNDVEIILLAEKFFETLNIRKKVNLQINTLGDFPSRKNYLNVLKTYFSDRKNNLSDESRKRLKTNPLRILDSKNPDDLDIIIHAPRIDESLNDQSKSFFSSLTETLKKLKINFIINPKLVRGLDYYNHTAFEYVTSDEKSQNAILAGGRYDGLVKSLGGNNVGGVGWAAGIERIILITGRIKEKDKKTISFFSTSDLLNDELLIIIKKLNITNLLSINFINSGNLKKKLSKANKIGSIGCIILGEDEWKDEKLIWKDFNSGKQETFPINDIQKFISKIISK